MQISFGDLGKLLDSADDNGCLILLDGAIVKYCDSYQTGLYIHCHNDATYGFTNDETVISLLDDEIELKTNNSITESIIIYKQPVTKEEYLTTLEFLKND